MPHLAIFDCKICVISAVGDSTYFASVTKTTYYVFSNGCQALPDNPDSRYTQVVTMYTN